MGKTLPEAHPCLFLFPTLCSKEACLQFPTLGRLCLVVTLENILLLTRMSGTCGLDLKVYDGLTRLQDFLLSHLVYDVH